MLSSGFLFRFIVISLLLIGGENLSAKDYASFAQLIVGGAEVDPKLDDGKSIPDDFYGTQIELLESSNLKRRALESLLQVNRSAPAFSPEQLDQRMQDIEVKATKTPGSRLIHILVLSPSAELPQPFLNCLMDEFLLFRRMLREQAFGNKLTANLQRVVSSQRALESVEAKLAEAGAQVSPTLKRQAEEARATYQEDFKVAKALSVEFESWHDVIQIMSRATKASEMQR